jgi:hypothetical protein
MTRSSESGIPPLATARSKVRTRRAGLRAREIMRLAQDGGCRRRRRGLLTWVRPPLREFAHPEPRCAAGHWFDRRRSCERLFGPGRPRRLAGRTAERRAPMTSPVYVSLDHQDPIQRRSFEELAVRGPHLLDAHDRLLSEPLLDARGRRVWLTPTDRRSEPLREALRERLARCDRLLVLIGPTTVEHVWVDWEIRTFFDLKQRHATTRTWKYLRGLRMRGYRGAEPAALAGRATVTLDWSPAAVTRWLETAL